MNGELHDGFGPEILIRSSGPDFLSEFFPKKHTKNILSPIKYRIMINQSVVHGTKRLTDRK